MIRIKFALVKILSRILKIIMSQIFFHSNFALQILFFNSFVKTSTTGFKVIVHFKLNGACKMQSGSNLVTNITTYVLLLEVQVHNGIKNLLKLHWFFFNLPVLNVIGIFENTGGPLLTLFFKTLEKQQCKQKTVQVEE